MTRGRPWLVGASVALCLVGAARAGDPTNEELSRFIKKGPRPPERVGEQIKLPFPPPPQAQPTRPAVSPSSTPLAIVLHQPEGTEQTPPAISVTFNQPMVAVSSVAEVSRTTPPIRVEPAVAGAFKWLGTTTLSLQPKVRLPYATHFDVTVPAGTASATGQRLAAPFRFGFATPRPVIVQSQPANGSTEIGLDPAIILGFNQAVHAEQIAAHVHLTATSGESIPLGAVPRAAWAGDPRWQGYTQASNAGFFAIFVPTAPLTPHTHYRVEVSAGLVADEGPLPMTAPFSASFATYAPLAVNALGCGGCWGEQSVAECQVGSSLCVSFNHDIKIAAAEPYVRVTPPPKNLQLRINGNTVTLDVKFQPETSYRVSVAAGVRDSYGQTLAKPWERAITYKHLPPSLELLVPEVALIEKSGRLELPLRLLNVDEFTVEAFLLPNDAIGAGLAIVRDSLGSSEFEAQMQPLRRHRVARWPVRPGLPHDRSEVYALALKQLVRDHGPGPYLLAIDKGPRAALVQITDVGLTARYDSSRMVVLATSIATGKPQPGVRLGVANDAATATTGADGTAVLRATARPADQGLGELLLLASLGNDRSFVRAASYGDDDRSTSLNWGAPRKDDYQRTFLYPDRDLYRPGEDVHVYGVHRYYGGGIADRMSPQKNPAVVTWSVRSSRHRELGQGSTVESAFGAFQFRSAFRPKSIWGRCRSRRRWRRSA